MEGERRSVQSRLSYFGRRKGGHRRQTSALSRSSILAEPIQEEPAVTITIDERYALPPVSDDTTATYPHAVPKPSPMTSPEAPKPLAISKRREPKPVATMLNKCSSDRLSVGMDAFQMARQSRVDPCRIEDVALEPQPRHPAPIVAIAEEDQDWEEISNQYKIKWARFCQEATSELQKR